MDYAGIFDVPPLEAVGISVLQTASLFCALLIGLRLIGRRVFAEKSPQDLIIIVLVAEACDLGLADERAGFWGSVASVLTIFILGYLTERISAIRHLLNPKPLPLYRDGKLYRDVMGKHMIDEDDLNELARAKGFASYKSFEEIALEGDGRISGFFKNK
jgi:uncharacterized membrane protein YcaP (DUF421 family)